MFYLNVDLKINSFFPSSTRDWNELKPEISNYANIHTSISIAVLYVVVFLSFFFSLRNASNLPHFEIFSIYFYLFFRYIFSNIIVSKILYCIIIASAVICLLMFVKVKGLHYCCNNLCPISYYYMLIKCA